MTRRAERPAPPRFRARLRMLVGVAGLVTTELLLALGQPFVRTYCTPLMWTFYILLVDGAIEARRGHSPMTRRPRDVVCMALGSVAIWTVFELYNLRMHGWIYVGLPDDVVVRLIGYVWAFATIGPGILFTRELIDAMLPGEPASRQRPAPLPAGITAFSVALGSLALAAPLVAPDHVVPHLWAAVWGGFIFLADPFNAHAGRQSVWVDALEGRSRRLWTLLAAGVVTGALWEFWNYWASAKWIYTFPLLVDVRIFEMPIIGFVGFPPFAVETYVLTELLAPLWRGNADNEPPHREARR